MIAKAGKPLVKVMALNAPEAGQRRRLGFIAGQITVPDDFDRMGDAEIERLFTGERLDQSDLDVWLAIKHLCSRVPLGGEAAFSAPELFRLLGKSDGQANREALKRSLQRMFEASVSLEAPSGAGFAGHMIDWWKWDAESCRFSVVLSPRMAPLFDDEDLQPCWPTPSGNSSARTWPAGCTATGPATSGSIPSTTPP